MKDVIAAYDALVARAIDVVDKAPYWKYISEPKFARLSVDGDEAVLIWPDTETDYDWTRITEQAVQFDARLLRLPDDELTAWKAEQMRLYEQGKKEREEAARAEREESERRTLAALKAKYEQAGARK